VILLRKGDPDQIRDFLDSEWKGRTCLTEAIKIKEIQDMAVSFFEDRDIDNESQIARDLKVAINIPAEHLLSREEFLRGIAYILNALHSNDPTDKNNIDAWLPSC